MNTISRVQNSAGSAIDLIGKRPMNRRLVKDRLFKHLMSLGGISVIIAVSAIFFYLASVVVPLFTPPAIESQTQFAAPGEKSQRTALLSGEEQREIGIRVGDAGGVAFFHFGSGDVIANAAVSVPAGAQITSFALGEPRTYSLGFGLSDGRVVVAKQKYEVTYPDNKRLITPSIEYPLGDAPLVIDPLGKPIVRLSIQQSGDGSTIVALTEDGRLFVSAINVTTNMMTGESRSEEAQVQDRPIAFPAVDDPRHGVGHALVRYAPEVLEALLEAVEGDAGRVEAARTIRAAWRQCAGPLRHQQQDQTGADRNRTAGLPRRKSIGHGHAQRRLFDHRRHR